MAEAVRIRLVRCPKCANLLTELPGFSLYKCGGCGAVLQAKKKAFLKDGLMGTPDDSKGVKTSAECDANNMSEIYMESPDGIGRDSVEKYDRERVTSVGNSMSRFGNGEPRADFDASLRGKERTRRRGYYDDEKTQHTQGLVRHRNHDEFSHLNINTPEYGNFHGEQRRYGSFPYHGMDPPSYALNSHHEHVERTRFNDQGLYGFARVEKLEHDRVELLMKLDELKCQLDRSWDMDDRPIERMVSLIPPHSYGRLHNAYAQGLNSSHGANKMSLSANDLESPYFSHNHGHSPHMSRFDSSMQDSYPPRAFPHEFGGYRPPQQTPYGRMRHPYHEDVRGYYSDSSPDRMLHQRRQFLHRPSCSCEHCCNRNLYVPPKIDRFKPLHQPYSHNINHHPDPMLHVSQGYNSGGSTLLSRQYPTLKSADLDHEDGSLNGHRDRKVDVAHGRGRLCHPILGGAPFITCCSCFVLLKLPRKHFLAKKRKMKCGSCFSVITLELGSEGYFESVSSHGDPISTDVGVGFNKAATKVYPPKCEFTDNTNYDKPTRQLDPPFAISSISVNEHDTHTSEKSNFDEPEKLLHPLSGNSSTSMDKHDMTNEPNPDDLEKLIDPTNKSNYDGFGKQVDPLSSISSSSVGQHYVETSHKSSLDESKKQVGPLSVMSTVSVGNHETDKKLDCGESEKWVDTHFATPSNSTDITNTDQKYDNESGKQLDAHFATLHISEEHITEDNLNFDKREKQPSPLPSTNMTSAKHYNVPEEYRVHSSGNNISSQFDEGDQSNLSELALDRATTSQNSANCSGMENETGVSINAFANRCISNYSGEISEEDHPRVKIKGESLVVGATAKSSHDTSDYDQSLNESKVFVNGHFIPNRDVKKAENLAGPIQPGEYWYDVRAGFWGVMGRPCLGIIMPDIEEFNYPVPENCAAGNTGVLVNGRELHQKDLDILASRGLPILKYGSYSIDISGKVVDERTGEELDCLGKLAPTVERENRGFGMRVP